MVRRSPVGTLVHFWLMIARNCSDGSCSCFCLCFHYVGVQPARNITIRRIFWGSAHQKHYNKTYILHNNQILIYNSGFEDSIICLLQIHSDRKYRYFRSRRCETEHTFWNASSMSPNLESLRGPPWRRSHLQDNMGSHPGRPQSTSPLKMWVKLLERAKSHNFLAALYDKLIYWVSSHLP
jgi:hypothetical protein